MESGRDGDWIESRVQELIDRWDLVELIDRLGMLIDTKGFGELGLICTNDVVWEPPHNLPVRTGLDATATYIREGIEAFGPVQHIFTNTLVDIDGNVASIRANQIAIHGDPSGVVTKHFDAGLTYRFDAVRTSIGWRVSRAKIAVIWTSGDSSSPAVRGLTR